MVLAHEASMLAIFDELYTCALIWVYLYKSLNVSLEDLDKTTHVDYFYNVFLKSQKFGCLRFHSKYI